MAQATAMRLQPWARDDDSCDYRFCWTMWANYLAVSPPTAWFPAVRFMLKGTTWCYILSGTPARKWFDRYGTLHGFAQSVCLWSSPGGCTPQASRLRFSALLCISPKPLTVPPVYCSNVVSPCLAAFMRRAARRNNGAQVRLAWQCNKGKEKGAVEGHRCSRSFSTVNPCVVGRILAALRSFEAMLWWLRALNMSACPRALFFGLCSCQMPKILTVRLPHVYRMFAVSAVVPLTCSEHYCTPTQVAILEHSQQPYICLLVN